MSQSVGTAVSFGRGDDHFDDLAATVRNRASRYVGRPLFAVDVGDLFQVFLAGLAPEHRQAHRCHACRTFLQRYGNIAVIDEVTGVAQSVFWPRVSEMPMLPGEYADAVYALAKEVSGGAVGDVFLSKEKVWGVGVTGEWRHFSMEPLNRPFEHPLKTAGQMVAEKHEEYAMLSRALADFPQALVLKAAALLATDTLYRSEKVLGVAQWLLQLHENRESTPSPTYRRNLTWLAVATAPAGFCHVRSTMIGSLLEDLAAGMPFDQVSRRFQEKMHPLQYQRPQAPPSEGNIAQAEKVVEALKSAGALERRFAKLSDLKPLWVPPPKIAPPAGEGVFSHLRQGAKAESPLEMGKPITMTWTKFARELLPKAETIECLVPGHGHFVAMVTAVNPDAPPILQWDFEGARNPVSWYLYHGGSIASNWNLRAGSFCDVTALTLSPAKWGDRPSPNQADRVFAILAGARDRQHDRGGGFFPEILKSDYHAIRRTMEAHAQASKIAGADEGDACGIDAVGSGVVFRVLSNGIRGLYILDRWD